METLSAGGVSSLKAVLRLTLSVTAFIYDIIAPGLFFFNIIFKARSRFLMNLYRGQRAEIMVLY